MLTIRSTSPCVGRRDAELEVGAHRCYRARRSHRHSARRETGEASPSPRIEMRPSPVLRASWASLKLRAARRQVDARTWPVEVPDRSRNVAAARDTVSGRRRGSGSAPPVGLERAVGLKSGVELRDLLAARGSSCTVERIPLGCVLERKATPLHARRLPAQPAAPPRFSVAFVILRRRIDLRGFALDRNSARRGATPRRGWASRVASRSVERLAPPTMRPLRRRAAKVQR